MIDWVEELCKDWGAYRRKGPKAWSSKSVEWRMKYEQGAKSNKPSTKVPFWHQDPRVMEVHRIWRDMPIDLKELMQVFYEGRGSPKDKADYLSMSRTRLYEMRDNLHYYIAGRWSDKKDSGLSHEGGISPR